MNLGELLDGIRDSGLRDNKWVDNERGLVTSLNAEYSSKRNEYYNILIADKTVRLLPIKDVPDCALILISPYLNLKYDHKEVQEAANSGYRNIILDFELLLPGSYLIRFLPLIVEAFQMSGCRIIIVDYEQSGEDDAVQLFSTVHPEAPVRFLSTIEDAKDYFRNANGTLSEFSAEVARVANEQGLPKGILTVDQLAKSARVRGRLEVMAAFRDGMIRLAEDFRDHRISSRYSIIARDLELSLGLNSLNENIPSEGLASV